MSRRKNLSIFIVLGLLFAAAFVLALALGGSEAPLTRLFGVLIHPGSDPLMATILWRIRLPRVVLGAFVGMGLGASGCIFQGMLRNPLADPYTLGISGGAALGTTLGIVFGLAGISVLFLPACSFAGTFLCIFVVYAIASRSGFSTPMLILGGVILGYIFASTVLLIFAVANASKVHSAMIWLMGDLSSAEPALIRAVAVLVLAGTLLLSFFGRELNALTLGDEKAAHLGVDTRRVKKILFVTASFVTAACVAASGIIGFVGLMLPHLMRRLVGPDHEVLVPASALAGAIFLPLCDTLARTIIAPIELPVGVITGFFGGIFFLAYLLKAGKGRGWQ